MPTFKPTEAAKRDKANTEYEAYMTERKRKERIMLARIESTEENTHPGRDRLEASTAISLKRIADALEQVLVELRRQGGSKT